MKVLDDVDIISWTLNKNQQDEIQNTVMYILIIISKSLSREEI